MASARNVSMPIRSTLSGRLAVSVGAPRWPSNAGSASASAVSAIPASAPAVAGCDQGLERSPCNSASARRRSATNTTAVDLAKRFADLSLGAVLYTDVARDGTQIGPNVAATAKLAKETGLSVLASGGVGTLDHLRELARHPEIAGAVVGRAIYEGSFTVEDALDAASGEERAV